jgi:hypothetical protein
MRAWIIASLDRSMPLAASIALASGDQYTERAMATPIEDPSLHMPRRRFTWRRFWITYALVCVVLALTGGWLEYENYSWHERHTSYWQQFDTAAKPLGGATLERVTKELGLGPPEKTTRSRDGRYLELHFPSPFPHYYISLSFVDGAMVYYYFVERPPYPTRTHSDIEQTAIWTVFKTSEHAVRQFAAGPWLFAFLTALIWRDKRKTCAHIMLAFSILWCLTGSIDWLVSPYRFRLDYVSDAGSGLIAVAISIAVLIWGYRARPIQPFPTCPRCRYNLTGNVSGICPECGTPVPPELRGSAAAFVRPNDV